MEKSPETKILDKVTENIKLNRLEELLENIKFKRLDEAKNMPDLAEVMRQWGQPQPNSDFTAKLASELVDGFLAKHGDLIEGVLAKQGPDKRQPQYRVAGLPSLNSVSTYELVEQFLATKRAANLSEVSLRSNQDQLKPFATTSSYFPTTL